MAERFSICVSSVACAFARSSTAAAAFHQGLGLLELFLGFRPLGDCQRRLQLLCRARLVALQIGKGLFDFSASSRQTDVVGGKLNLAQVDMRGERIIRHLLRSRGALAGFLDFRFGDHLVGHHADRQQDADRPGQAQFVSDTVELDHVDDPKFF